MQSTARRSASGVSGAALKSRSISPSAAWCSSGVLIGFTGGVALLVISLSLACFRYSHDPHDAQPVMDAEGHPAARLRRFQDDRAIVLEPGDRGAIPFHAGPPGPVRPGEECVEAAQEGQRREMPRAVV